MPAYDFQERFVPKILDKSKPHTIRRRRKNPTKVGDVIKMFVGLRTKRCRQFAEAKCVKVEPVVIYPSQHLIKVNGFVYGTGAAMKLAQKDGFTNLADFFEFFQRYKRDVLDDFEIIWWDPKELTPIGLRPLPPNQDQI